MGKIYESITPELAAWIDEQPMFFVATAPLAADGHVNLSPKGLDCLRITGPRQVAYLDLTGSGAETIAHLRENGRIVFMFCAFTGPPKIVRLHGHGRVMTPASAEWGTWLDRFPAFEGHRSIMVVDVTRVSDSCGYAVPQMAFVEQRDVLLRWARTQGADALPDYRRQKNATSIDGLPALTGPDF